MKAIQTNTLPTSALLCTLPFYAPKADRNFFSEANAVGLTPHTRAPISILPALFLLTTCLGKQRKMVQVHGSLTPVWETLIEFQATDFSPDHCDTLVGEPVDGKAVSTFLCYSFKDIDVKHFLHKKTTVNLLCLHDTQILDPQASMIIYKVLHKDEHHRIMG